MKKLTWRLPNISLKEQGLPRRKTRRDAMRRTFLVAFLGAAIGGAVVPGGVRAQTCAANVPHVTGTWVVLPYQMPINPISASLLPTGHVLIVSGSENDAKNNSTGAESYRAAIWDPTGKTEGSIAVQNLSKRRLQRGLCHGEVVLIESTAQGRCRTAGKSAEAPTSKVSSSFLPLGVARRRN
jgi:hypothetical protein